MHRQKGRVISRCSFFIAGIFAVFSIFRGISWAGLLYRDVLDNARFRQLFGVNEDLFIDLQGICNIRLDGDPSPNIASSIFEGTVFMIDPPTGRLVWNWVREESGNYNIGLERYFHNQEMRLPQAVAASPAGNVYIADVGNHRIIKLKSRYESNKLKLDYAGEFGTYGNQTGQFDTPMYLAVGTDGHVWVSDFNNHRVQEFDAIGNFLSSVGGYGDGQGEFKYPRGIYAGGDALYVADAGNHRIQVFTRISGNFRFTREIRAEGTIPIDAFMTGITETTGGAKYVVDRAKNQIYLFDGNWDHIATYQGNGASRFHDLRDISISVKTPNSHYPYQAVVAENNRIQNFYLGMEAINVHTDPGYFHPLAPENNVARLKYTLTEHGFVKLYVRNNGNKIVRTLLVDRLRALGKNEEVWDGRDNSGNICPGGEYMFELTAFDTNANGHAVRWEYKCIPVTIHEAPAVAIRGVNPGAIYTGGVPALVSYGLNKDALVLAAVYDAADRLVWEYSEYKPAGEHTVAWDGKNLSGLAPADGYYTIIIKAKNTGPDGKNYWGLAKSIQVALANGPPSIEIYPPYSNIYGKRAVIRGRIQGFLLAAYKIEYSNNNGEAGIICNRQVSENLDGDLAVWDTTSLPLHEEGGYTLTITATNQANVSGNTEQGVTVDNIAPRLKTFSIFPEYISPQYAATGSTQNAASVDYAVDDIHWDASRLEFYDKHLSLRKTISLPGQTGSASWNGMDESMLEIPDGLVICRITARDTGDNETVLEKQLVIDTNRYPESIAVAETVQLCGPCNSNYKLGWHPDGRRVAYTESTAASSYIYLVNVDDGGAEVIQRAGAGIVLRDPDIHPDAATFLYGQPSAGNIIQTNLPGQTFFFVRLATNAYYGQWSPDGSKIAFARPDGTNTQIWIKNAPGAGEEYMTNGYFPNWSPDGKYIVYGTGRDMISDHSDIYAISVSDKSISGPIVTNAMYPEYSPDGNMLVYLHNQYGFGVLTADGRNINLISTPHTQRMATWSPDGSKLAYVQHDGATYVANLSRPDQYANLTAVLLPVMAGDVEVKGTAADMNFHDYELSFSPVVPNPFWTAIAASKQEIREGVLGEWDTTNMTGAYWLRLTVRDKALNRKEYYKQVRVSILGPNVVFELRADPEVIFPDIPGKDSTVISYTLRSPAEIVGLEIYNATQELIRVLTPAQDPVEDYPVVLSVPWDGRDEGNQTAPAGTYTIKLQARAEGETIIKQAYVKVEDAVPVAIITLPVMNGYTPQRVVFEGTAGGYDFAGYTLSVTGALYNTYPETVVAENNQPVFSNILGAWDALQDETYQAVLKVKNGMGNEAQAQVVFQVDSAPPVTHLEFEGQTLAAQGKYYLGLNHIIRLSGFDAGIGVKETQVGVDGLWQAYTEGFALSQPGEHTIQYYSLDHFENREQTQTQPVVFNALKPSTVMAAGEPQYQAADVLYISGRTEILLSAQEEGETAVPVLETQWAARPEELNAPNKYTGPITLASYSGNRIMLQARSMDALGNTEDWRAFGPLWVDVTDPEITIQCLGRSPVVDPQGVTHASMATYYQLQASDLESGTHHMEYKINTGTADSWQEFVAGESIYLTSEGFQWLQYRAIDQVGNSSAAFSWQVVLDNRRPEIMISGIEEGRIYVPPVAIEISATDEHLREAQYSLDGMPYDNQTPVTGLGNHVLEAQACDWAGNSSFARISFTLGQATATPTGTRTATETMTSSATPTPSPTASFTATESSTCSATPTWTMTPTVTPSMTSSNTPSSTSTPEESMTATASGTASPSRTISMTMTQTAVPTSTPTDTATANLTSTETSTDTATATQTWTPSASWTPTFSSTATPALTHTYTCTATETMTITTVPGRTSTPLPEMTATSSASCTNSPTGTATTSSTPTPSITATHTCTPTVAATPRIPQHVWAWLDGWFVLLPGESRKIMAVSKYRHMPQPDIPLRFALVHGNGSLEGQKEIIRNTGPMAGPAEVLFHSTNEDEIDINIIRVDNMGLGKKAHLLLIVLSKHAHKKHGCQARAAAFGNEGFEEEAEALKAAELFVEAACIKPKATLTATATLTNTSTPLATATPTMTIIPTDTATPTPVAVPVMDGKIIAYPQPARDLVRFALATPEAAWVKLEVYNLAGEKVAEVAEYKTAAPWGTFVEWRCRQAAPGFYLCRIDIRGDDGSRRQISLKIAVAH